MMNDRKEIVRNKGKRKELSRFLILLIISVIYLLPVLFVVLTSFKTDAEVSLQNFKWFPSSLDLTSFENAWKMTDWIRAFGNSLIVTLVVVILAVLINSIAGYAFARIRFKGSNALFIILLMGMMIPAQAIAIPQFIIVKKMGIYDTLVAVIICYLSAPMGVFLSKTYYTTFPKELDESAKLDGCTPFTTYLKIYLPMSKTLFSTLVILKGVQVWNDFFYPLIMTSSESLKTVQLALQLFKGSTTTHYNWLMAATLFTSLPMIILYFCAQKYFVAGIQTTGMKN